ncbi:protein gamete expressed 1 [Quercus suber]|uniref:Protein gamete expressed 1 n=1 Tax=Quercus suber TaxID=58331 RepID=A0AAW0LHD9_QUESU
MQNEVTLKSARKENDEGIERVNNARRKLTGLKSCWYDAYQGLFAKCSDITTTVDNERRKRFGWDLSNCFQNESGNLIILGINTEKLVNQLVISANNAEE